MSDVPEDFLDALKSKGLDAFFLGQAPSHQRETLKWIEEAKRAETRERRITKAVEFIRQKSR